MIISDRLKKLESRPIGLDQRLTLAKKIIRSGGADIHAQYSEKIQYQALEESKILLLGSDNGIPSTDDEFKAAQRLGWSRVCGTKHYPKSYPNYVEELIFKVVRRLAELRPLPLLEVDETYA